MQYNLEFQGYTWDDYFYMISTKKGVLITYKGSIDQEGAVKMDEILYIEGADSLASIYEGNLNEIVRTKVNAGEMLFFSYAETDNDYQKVAEALISCINPKFNKRIDGLSDLCISCKGACALFPQDIISE